MGGGNVGRGLIDRRRKWMLIALGTLMIASTSLVSNQRALFRPMGSGPILGEALPQAYAMIIPGTRGGSTSRTGGGEADPGAFGLRIPQIRTTTDRTSPQSSQSSFLPPPDTAMVESATTTTPMASGVPGTDLIGLPGLGYGDPGAGGGLPGSSNGTLPGGGGGPIGGTTPAVPEPASWVIMLFGIGVVGAVMRRARRSSRGARSSHLPNA
jgi:hypothetical protein